MLAEAMTIEASTVAFLVLLTLSAWKVVEVIAWVRQHTQLRAPTPVRAMPQPVPKPLPKRKPVRGAGEVLTQAEAHALEVAADYLRRIEFLQTREGKMLHLRGCQQLRGSDGRCATTVLALLPVAGESPEDGPGGGEGGEGGIRASV